MTAASDTPSDEDQDARRNRRAQFVAIQETRAVLRKADEAYAPFSCPASGECCQLSTTKRELYTLPVGLASFSGEFQREWEMVMAGASVATLPVLLVFVVLQRYIVRGIMLAGIKG